MNLLRLTSIIVFAFISAGSTDRASIANYWNQDSDVESLSSFFVQRFNDGYEAGRCQYNIRSFTAQAHARGIDLSGALYLTFSGYGDVWYYHGRSNNGKPASGTWFHHYVLAIPTDGSSDPTFSTKRNYAVIDFDYGSGPKLVPLKTYMREMFIPKSIHNDDNKIGRDFSLGLMKVTAHDTLSLVSQLQSSGEFPRGAEAKAIVFKETPFRDLYRELKH